MNLNKVLKDLTELPAVSGHEYALTDCLNGYLSKYCDEVKVDQFYNVIGVKKGNGKNKRKIMITAHSDEIGFLVTSIDKKGFVRFTNIGGVDPKILLSQEVFIHGKEKVFGVIGAKPPHLLNHEEVKNAVKMNELYIDIGLNEEKAKELICIGDYITFHTKLTLLKNNKLASKTMDNRAGVVTILNLAEKLFKENLNNDIYYVSSVQEEVGLRGAMMTSYNLEPDIAIVIDGCMGSYPNGTKEDVFDLNKGPAIAVGPNLHKKCTDTLIEVAKKNKIPYQIDVEAGNTGTEAWAIQVSKCGVPTMLISIPLRYMHTTIETIDLNDIKNTTKLIYEFIREA